MRQYLLLRGSLVGVVAVTGCNGSLISAEIASPNPDAIPVHTVLHATEGLRPPAPDSAGVTVVGGNVIVTGLFNQALSCFPPTAEATRTAAHLVGSSVAGTNSEARLVLRVTAQLVPGCETVVRGHFDYDVVLQDIPGGAYDVEIVHRAYDPVSGYDEEWARTARAAVP